MVENICFIVFIVVCNGKLDFELVVYWVSFVGQANFAHFADLNIGVICEICVPR
jgi:hypothetical protein